MERVPIEMIFWSDTEGNVKPLKFRAEDAEQMLETAKIISSVLIDENRIAGNRMRVFRCSVLFDNFIKECDIRYEVDSCRWFLYEIR